jgi:uncharacterized protein (DUF1697 family)
LTPKTILSKKAVRHVALLRAINVGGHVVTMEHLRVLFEQLSFADVRTFIASGNVIFEASRGGPEEIELAIEAHLKKALGYEVTTFVRSPAEIREVVDRATFADEDLAGASIYVLFLKQRISAAGRKALKGLSTALDDFETGRREIYWLRRNVKERIGEPPPPIERVLSGPATSRNITTVRKIAAKFCQ